MNVFKNPKSLPILSGLLIGTSYIPFPPWAVLFALVPLWWFWLKQNNWKAVFISGWITQFILNLIGFHWIAYTVTEFGLLPWYVGIAVLLLFCALAHLYYPLAGCLWFFLTKKFKLSQKQSLLLLPMTFLLIERVYPFIFFWHFGYTWLWAGFPGSQAAEWIGFYGLNVISVLCNLLILRHLLNRKGKLWGRNLAAALALFLGINALGILASKAYKGTDDQTLKVIAVQGNIGNLDKLAGEHGGRAAEVAIKQFLKLSEEAVRAHPEAKVLIWPETAFPETIYPGRTGRHMQALKRFLKKYQVDLITGAYQFFPGDTKPYNAMVLIQKDGTVNAGYQKTHLLAFGEYFPAGDSFPILKKWFPMVSDFGRGKGARPFSFGDMQVGGQICYEGLFDTFSAELQNQGAQWMVNITNDSWFGYPFEPNQHMYMTLARAIETRRSLVRVTNTGITAAITASGDILEFSPHGEAWFGTFEIPYSAKPRPTLYAKIAPLWPYLLFLVLIGYLGGVSFARLRKH